MHDRGGESLLNQEPFRCGLVAVLGETNAGKSTLINRLVGQKVSIVSRKVQTTLFRILGVALHGNSQIILIDTPGFVSEEGTSFIEKEAWSAFKETEQILYLVDVHKKNFDRDISILQKLKTKEVSLVLNKVDLVKKEILLELADYFSKNSRLENVFMISGMTGSGVGFLKSYLSRTVPEREWLFPEDEVTNLSFEKFASEISREHLYHRVHKEIPYNCIVVTESCKEEPDGSININQVIYVKNKSHKMILVGHNGDKIKAIGTASRRELCELSGKTIHLFLDVVVEK